MAGALARFCALSLLCVTLLACSRTEFMYNRLDFILPWYVDGYASLDREQEAYLDELLDPFLEWHRSRELPCYQVLLADAQASLDGELTTADLEALSGEFERAWYRTEERALQWLLELGERLSDEQVAGFLEEVDEKQEELEEEYLSRSDEEFREDSLERMEETAGDYLGRLEPAQREHLQRATDALLRSDPVWLAERAAFIRRMAVELQREPGWQERLRELVAARDTHLSPEYLEVLEHNVGVLQAAAVAVLNSRSERQDRHLRERLAGLQEDLDNLIADSSAGAGASCEMPRMASVQQ